MIKFVLLVIGLLFAPVTVDTPIFDGATIITGSAAPNTVVTLRVIQNPALTQTAQTDSEGSYQFTLDVPLKAGYIVQVQDNSTVDYAIVERVVGRMYLPLVGASW